MTKAATNKAAQTAEYRANQLAACLESEKMRTLSLLVANGKLRAEIAGLKRPWWKKLLAKMKRRVKA